MLEINNIYNIDCIAGMKNLPDNSVQMVLTDIPYGELNNVVETQLRVMNKGNADVITFDLNCFLEELNRVCSGSFYIFCGFNQISEITRFAKERKMMTRVCSWKKRNPSPMMCQYFWLSDVEFCVAFKKPQAVFNYFYKSSVWDFKAGERDIHPTQKNVELFRYLILASSNEGDVVLDPCVGSGTTAVAAIQEKRNFIGFELNEEYYKKAVERIANEKSQLTLF